ncbi:MAG TPA: guanylate kinase [Candidatus Limnocylindrales bacterium]|jgi:guanylate kinase
MRKRVIGQAGAMIVIISGPSGVGKDTILRCLRQEASDPPRHYVVTYKTRLPRPNEVEGIDYQFITTDEFEKLLAKGRLLESALVHGDWSGTPRDQVVEALTSGRDAILKIDVQGAEAIHDIVPDALRIFVAPPDEAQLEARLRGRGTETPEELARRNADAEEELRRRAEFDYVVVNENNKADRTAEQIDEIIRHEHHLYPDRRIEF